MAEHKLPQKAGYKIQADRQNDIDADEHQNAGVVGIDYTRRNGSHDRGKKDCHPEDAEEIGKLSLF
jgi:hypothetical protein